MMRQPEEEMTSSQISDRKIDRKKEESAVVGVQGGNGIVNRTEN